MSNNRTPIYRSDDNELVGHIRQNANKDELWQPLTIFGYPLADFMPKNKAIKYLQLHGLEALIDNWQFFDESDKEWYSCDIVEAKPDLLVVRISDYGHPYVYQMVNIPQPNKQKVRRR